MPLELAIDQEHGQPGVQYRQRDQDKERVDEIHPGKERQTSHRHAWPATGDHGRDRVNRETNRPQTQDEDRYRPVIDAGSGRIRRLTQRRIGEPADRRGAPGENAKVQKNSAKRLAPEPEGVQARERHVTRTDLQRQHVIHEAEQQRHSDEKNNRCAVQGEKLVEGVGMKEVVVRHCQLQTDEKRFDSADDEKEQAGQHVENTDALVIDGGKPRELIVSALGRIQDRLLELLDSSSAVHCSVERYSLSWFSCSSVKLKSGMSAPGLMCCGLLSQRRMFAGVFSRIPAPSCLRLPTCVRSGATRKSAPATPRIAWQLMQVDV